MRTGKRKNKTGQSKTTQHTSKVLDQGPITAKLAEKVCSSRRRHTISVSAFLLNRSSDFGEVDGFETGLYFLHRLVAGEGTQPGYIRSEERRGGEEGRSRWAPDP